MAGTLVTRIDFPGGRRFEVVIYDLLAEPTEAIVNAANGGLSHGGGVAAAISKAAGAALDDEGNRIVQERGRIPLGEAVVTTAGQLPFKGVIHAVGPRLGDGKEGERIVQALKAAFLRAHERGWASVSFPGISAGIFAVPPEVCARAYLQAVREFFAEFPNSPVVWIRLVLFQGPLLEAVKRELRLQSAWMGARRARPQHDSRAGPIGRGASCSWGRQLDFPNHNPGRFDPPTCSDLRCAIGRVVLLVPK